MRANYFVTGAVIGALAGILAVIPMMMAEAEIIMEVFPILHLPTHHMTVRLTIVYCVAIYAIWILLVIANMRRIMKLDTTPHYAYSVHGFVALLPLAATVAIPIIAAGAAVNSGGG